MKVSRHEDPLIHKALALAEQVVGRPVDRWEAVAAGLGARRFFRIHFRGGSPASLIARLDPADPPQTNGLPPEPPLEPIHARLEAAGLPVPRRWGGESGEGQSHIELLEDLGPEGMDCLVQRMSAEDRQHLYREALALLPPIQALILKQSGDIEAFQRRLDEPLVRSKENKWLEWTLPRALDRRPLPSEVEATRRAFDVIVDACLAAPLRLAHRDFKAANLHQRPASSETGPAQLVMIDFQGAFMAPPEYDVVCLLQDAQALLPESEIRAHQSWIRPQLPAAPDPTEFSRRFDLLAVARLAKDISHFTQAAWAQNDRRYLRFIPGGLTLLRAAARRASSSHAALADFAEICANLPEHFADAGASEASGDPPCAP
ncbi:MAG: phosphotransferase [Myxococcota bacterium]|nr:phosphotransferase [Myxococcota bacterium]